MRPYPDTAERIPANGRTAHSYNGEAAMEFTCYALSQEQADKLLAVIEGSSKTVDRNPGIYSMVSQEAQAFFAGQKSAGEVAKLIQSKVSLYLSEQT